MARLSNSITANIRAALTDEAESRNRNLYYADLFSNMGYDRMARYLLDIAQIKWENEKILYSLLQEPEGKTADVSAYLEAYVDQEMPDWQQKYAQMAEEAQAEGWDNMAEIFSDLSDLALQHERIGRNIAIQALELLRGQRDMVGV